MKVLRTAADVRAWRDAAGTVGLVPTMGALHEGHAALVDRAARENDVVIASIFVNPTQFGPNEDFAAYPRDTQKDLQIASNEGVDAIFNPSVEEIYPAGFQTFVEPTGMVELLDGASRPGHFRGVATV